MIDRILRKKPLGQTRSVSNVLNAILVAVVFLHASLIVRSSFGEAFIVSSTSALCHRNSCGTIAVENNQLHYNRYVRSGEESPTVLSVFSRLGSSDTAERTKPKPTPSNDSVRGYCPKCKRPIQVCICHALPKTPIDCGTRVLILQHPREFKKRKRTSTVPLIGLSLENVEICVGTTFQKGSHPLLDEALEIANGNNSNSHALLLYPSERAIPLQTFLEETQNANGSREDIEIGETSTTTGINNDNGDKGNILVVVDGTWAQTQTMVQNSPLLSTQLPSVMFDDSTESLFDALRQEPAEHCTSTLEAVSRAIRLMDSSNSNASMAADALETSLQAMVDGQLQFANDENVAKPRYYRKNNEDDETTTVSKRAERKARKLVSKKLKTNLSLPKAKTPEELEQDRIRFVYIAHMG